MKRPSVGDLYGALLLTIVGLMVVHAPITVLLSSTWPEYELLFKSWKELLLGAAFGMMLVIVTRRKLWPRLVREWPLRLSVAYGALHLIMVPIFWQGATSTAAGLVIDLRHVVLFSLVYIWVKIWPAQLTRLQRIVLVGAGIVVGFAGLQLLLPHDSLKYLGYGPETIMPYMTVDQNYEYVRYNSTLRGPNPMGAYAASVALVVLAVMTGSRQLRRKWWLYALGGLAVVAVYVSYARSAALTLAIGALVIILVRYATHLRPWHGGVFVVMLLAAVVSFSAVRQSDFVSNVILHESAESQTTIKSNDEHLASLHDGTGRLLRQPFGAGVGSTGSPSLLGENPLIIENEYLYVAHEVGWLGLALFVALYGVVLRGLWRLRRDDWALGVFASGLGLAVAGLFLPVWADDTVALIWWAIAGGVLAGACYPRHTPKKEVL